jgi:hypothetical protein
MPSQAIQLSTGQLRQALQLREQIDELQQRLNSILGGGGSSDASTPTQSASGHSPLKGRKLSPATLRKMRAAQQARWAKIKGDGSADGSSKAAAGSAKPVISAQKKKGGGGMTPEQRARISATLKARWAAKKKGEGAAAQVNPGAK